MNILHVEPDRYDDDARAVLAAVGDVRYAACADQDELRAAIGSAPYDALFVRLGLSVDDQLLALAPKLRFVVTPTTGLDHIDLDAAARRGVRIVSLRGQTALLESVSATAEHTWALLLALLRRVPWAFDGVRGGSWDREPYIGREVDGATLGVIGYGRLGTKVASYGAAFGMHVLAHDVDPARVASARGAGVESAAVDDLLARSDVVSLHLPLDDSTTGFLSADRLSSMRRGAVLVNTARGALVDEAAAARLVRDGHLAGIAVDVIGDDSTWDAATPGEHPFLDLAASGHPVLITPHVGGYAVEALTKTRRFVARLFATAVGEEP